jgi:Tol biopolymer transport system component
LFLWRQATERKGQELKTGIAITLTALFGWGLLPAAETAPQTAPGENGKIVFVRKGDLWVMGRRGGNETRLTKTEARETAPTVSPNGKRIAFTRTRRALPSQEDLQYRAAIFTMRLDGTGVRRLTGFRNANVGPSFSPNGKILYTWSSGEDNAQVRVMDRNGTNKKKLTGGRDNVSPVWARAGKRIAYFNRLGRRPGLYVMKADGSDKTRILVDPVTSVNVWGPAGRILYTTADGRIATIKPDGSSQRVLTTGYWPSYSPDGSRIAFQRCPNSTPRDCRFFVMDADGSDERRISATTRPSGGPTWSPDGRRLVVPFFRPRKKQWDLRLLTTGGSSLWLTSRDGIRRYDGAAWQAR